MARPTCAASSVFQLASTLGILLAYLVNSWLRVTATACDVPGPVRRGELAELNVVSCRLYETVKEPQPILILETLTGETLSYIIDTSYRRLPLLSVVNLGLHLCSAIHYLHTHGILHLDLKPSNIVSERGLAKMLDLSIARPPGQIKRGAGTKQYMAPKQVLGKHVGPATDVWGIGATLYEAATDMTPFNAEYVHPTSSNDPVSSGVTGAEGDPEDYEQLVRRADPVRLHRRVPAAFGGIVARCLDPDSDGRPGLAELSESLKTLT